MIIIQEIKNVDWGYFSYLYDNDLEAIARIIVFHVLTYYVYCC